MQLSDTFWKVFAGIGIASAVIVFVVLAFDVFDALRAVVRDLRWQYKYKHRFDKLPTAACYCKDCVHHGKNGNDYSERCDLPGVDRFTPHNGFCYMAKPMTAKEAKKHGE